jgi:hypothetical protein
MYTLTLSEQELGMLVDVLECAMSELHSEIVHTDRCDYKEELKARKQMLARLLENLKQIERAQPTGAG